MRKLEGVKRKKVKGGRERVKRRVFQDKNLNR
jgi:hypothetical protein